MGKLWRVWANTMGHKISTSDRESDISAIIRTAWWVTHMITCGFIIAGVIRHWNS